MIQTATGVTIALLDLSQTGVKVKNLQDRFVTLIVVVGGNRSNSK